MVVKNKSYSDSYKEQMVQIMFDLQKLEKEFVNAPQPKSNVQIKKQRSLIKKIVTNRENLSQLFFAYLIEDED